MQNHIFDTWFFHLSEGLVSSQVPQPTWQSGNECKLCELTAPGSKSIFPSDSIIQSLFISTSSFRFPSD